MNSKHKSDYGEWKLTAGNFYGDAEKDKGKPNITVICSYISGVKYESVLTLQMPFDSVFNLGIK